MSRSRTKRLVHQIITLTWRTAGEIGRHEMGLYDRAGGPEDLVERRFQWARRQDRREAARKKWRRK